MSKPTISEMAKVISAMAGVPVAAEITDGGWKLVFRASEIHPSLTDVTSPEFTHSEMEIHLSGLLNGIRLKEIGDAVAVADILTQAKVLDQLAGMVESVQREETKRRREMN